MNYISFQRGTLQKRPNKNGFTWVLRYRDNGVLKAMVLGTNEELPTEAAARREAASKVAVINETKKVFTMAQLIALYKKDELPMVRPDTAASYRTTLKLISAKYEQKSLPEMLSDLMEIGAWLGELNTTPVPERVAKRRTPAGIASVVMPGRPGRPLSKKYRQNIKAMLHRLVECAMRWGYLPIGVNPIGKVEIRIKKGTIMPRKRGKYPLTADEIKRLIEYPELSEHVRVMVKLCVFLGLRISEVLALRWENIDLESGLIHICSSSVGKHIDETKTPTSDDHVPIHTYLVETLRAWKEHSEPVRGWVFGSAITGRPFHRDSLQTDHLRPAGVALGIINLGWHTFRHTNIARLRKNGTAIEVQMMLARHADTKTTNSYGRDSGSMEIKRPAHESMVDALLEEIAG